MIKPWADCGRSLVAVGTILAALASAPAVRAQSCTSYPNTLSNGTTADANQVMANFNCAALLGGANFTGNVGVGTTNPLETFQVTGIPFFTTNYGGAFPSYGSSVGSVGGTIIGWNGQSTTPGETDFVNFPGAGTGGFDFAQANMSGAVVNIPMVITGGSASSGGGHVGIGTTNPLETFQVNGNPYFTTNYDGAFPSYGSSVGAMGGTILGWNGQSTSPGETDFVNFPGGGSGGFDFVQANSSGAVINTPMVITGGTAGSGGGRVGIGISAPSYTLYVNGSSGGTQGWTNTSDARLKTKITTISDALDIVDRLRGVRFRWRSPGEREVGKELALPLDEPQIGFIAQEVAKVLPEAVTVPNTGKDGPYGVRDSSILPILVEAIKAQQGEINALKAEVAALKSAK